MEMLISQPQRDLAAGPRLPVIYEEAVRDLQACRTIDEAKHFSDLSEILSYWGQFNKDERAINEAKRLRLWASKRLGEIAGTVRPARVGNVSGFGRGTLPGARGLLMEKGLSQGEADAARFLAKMPPEKFHELINQPRPPVPISARQATSYAPLDNTLYRSIGALRSILANEKLSDAARSCSVARARWYRAAISDIQEFLDEFERFLPK